MISPSDVVFVFADLQDSILENAKTNEPKHIRAVARAAAKIAKSLGIPAMASVVPFGPGEPKPIHELTDELPEMPVFPRMGPHMFNDSKTRMALTETGKKIIALCGCANEIVVLHGAVGARAEGYEVYVLLDATGGLSERTENAAIRQMEAKGCVTTSLASFATAMVTEFTTPEGGSVIGALRELWSR